MPRKNDRLPRVAGCHLCACTQENSEIVPGAVNGMRSPRNIRNRPRQNVKIVEKRRRKKAQLDLHAMTTERIPSVQRRQNKRRLLERWNGVWFVSHDPEALGVNAH